MSQTCVQKYFAILEGVVDWHELMILQHFMRPSIAHTGEQWTPGAARRHTTKVSLAPQIESYESDTLSLDHLHRVTVHVSSIDS